VEKVTFADDVGPPTRTSSAGGKEKGIEKRGPPHRKNELDGTFGICMGKKNEEARRADHQGGNLRGSEPVENERKGGGGKPGSRRAQTAW